MDLSTLTPAQLQIILDGPALVSPDGIYQLDNPPNQNNMAEAITIASLAVSTVAMLVRAYNRLFITRKVTITDCLAVVGYINFVALVYMFLHVAYFTPGWFVHQWDYRVKDVSRFLYDFHVGSNLTTAIFLVMKIAILLEWLRIFVPPGTRGTFFRTTWVLIVINTLFYSISIFVENFSCRPYQGIWDKTLPNLQCLDEVALLISAAALDTVSNLAVLILPQQVIWGLNLHLKKKLSISVLFAVGIFGCICSLFRLYFTIQVHNSKDVTYLSSGVALWSLGENVALFLIFCIPTIPKTLGEIGLYRAIASTLRSWATGGRSNFNSGNAKLSGEDGSRPLTFGQTGMKKRRMVDTDGIPLTDVSMLATKNADADSATHLEVPGDAHHGHGIVRTTDLEQVSVTSDRPDGPNQVDQFRLQHPWAPKR